ncbi:MAG: glycosyltransferase family 2 protein, partial [Solirubrobacteraceae bacterium]
ALDDDCYLPPGGLSHAIASAKEQDADLVSFAIGQPNDSDFRFNELYRTGMLSFWGCAVLIRRRVLERLSGYDPAIFIWANELEFMLRFFDSGFRHLHLPEVVAVHMKDTSGHWMAFFSSDSYRINAENFAYIAAKSLRPREAAEALVARLATHFKDAIRVDGAALRALPYCLRGFARGLRHRQPVTNSEISRVYRRNFQSFASPWWLLRPLPQFLRHGPGELARTRWRSGQKESRFLAGRREAYFIERPRYYPRTSSTLEFEAP